VNFPQTAALMEARHERAGLGGELYPEVHHAPLYSLVIAAGLRALPEAWREALFASPPVPPDGFAADYFLLGLNLALLWLAAWQTFRLGCRLFDERVGWVSMLALLSRRRVAAGGLGRWIAAAHGADLGGIPAAGRD